MICLNKRPQRHIQPASYNATTEELRLTVTEESYSPVGLGEPAVIRVLWVDVGSDADDTRRHPTTLRSENATNMNGNWYARNGTGVSAIPPEPGRPVTVTQDVTDRDGDGRTGLEPGDRIWITIQTTGGAYTRMGDVSVTESGACINPSGTWQSEC
jgi:hypothetical protein